MKLSYLLKQEKEQLDGKDLKKKKKTEMKQGCPISVRQGNR